MRWFRFYEEALNDKKVQRLSPQLFKTWINLLCLASKGSGKIPSDDDISFELRLSVSDAKQQLEDLILAGLIDIMPDGSREPHNWGERQFVSDTSRERTRKYRERRNSKPCDVTVTAEVTPPDTDTDTDTEIDITPLPPSQGDVAVATAKPKSKRGTRLAEDWELPDDWRQWVLVNCPASSPDLVEREAMIFANYWQSQPGQKACKLDWSKTWKNWCLKAFARGPVRSAPSAPATNWYEEEARKRKEFYALATGGALHG